MASSTERQEMIVYYDTWLANALDRHERTFALVQKVCREDRQNVHRILYLLHELVDSADGARGTAKGLAREMHEAWKETLTPEK